MARIAGVNIPKDKRVEISLTYITGIGKSLSNAILEKLKINPDTRVKDLTENEINLLRDEIAKFPTEGDLRRKVSLDIKRLQDIGSYRGYRHKRGLPVRGQATRRNSRTKRGKKITVGSGRKKDVKK
ncbi:30S ribosomal protein S13 [Candidatus Peregrinibacteria bacterium]|jgi:small subunit ribosomal protein S13|nr:30S ribosomal protein S13 [Candidatus Peregrinibacteria bacterium]